MTFHVATDFDHTDRTGLIGEGEGLSPAFGGHHVECLNWTADPRDCRMCQRLRPTSLRNKFRVATRDDQLCETVALFTWRFCKVVLVVVALVVAFFVVREFV